MNQTDRQVRQTTSEDIPAQRGREKGRGAGLKTVRAVNRRLILNYLLEHEPTPRVAIAKDLGLSRATVSNIIEELTEDNLVHEGEKIAATGAAEKGGRKPTQVYFNANAGYIVGIDMGRTHLIIYLTNLLAEPMDKRLGPFDMKTSCEDGLQFVAERSDELVRSNLGSWDLVRGIGLGIPGAPDRTLRMLISPLLLSNWHNVDIPAELRIRLGLKKDFPIYLDNDANMGALGESRYGFGRGVENLVYVKLGTGIGVGMILNGQSYRGSGGVAGEFGHVKIEEKSHPCPSCGEQGCLEALAGQRAIVDDARRGTSLHREHSLEGSRTAPELPALARYGGDIDMADVIIAARRGDSASRAALECAGKRIGTAIGSFLINVLNPSMILLDGGTIRASKDSDVFRNELLLDSLYQSAKDSSLPAAWQGTKILIGELGNSAIALGAVATVIDDDEEFSLPKKGFQSLVATS
jgi:predicted NBD/HSP70 family sugar kinase